MFCWGYWDGSAVPPLQSLWLPQIRQQWRACHYRCSLYFALVGYLDRLVLCHLVQRACNQWISNKLKNIDQCRIYSRTFDWVCIRIWKSQIARLRFPNLQLLWRIHTSLQSTIEKKHFFPNHFPCSPQLSSFNRILLQTKHFWKSKRYCPITPQFVWRSFYLQYRDRPSNYNVCPWSSISVWSL